MATTSWFTEQFLKDEKGVPVKNHIIHEIWHEHIQWCRDHGKYAGIIAPMGLGKTENVIVSMTLYYLAEDQNYRIKIICNSNDNAKDRVTSIKKYVEQDTDYQALAPEVKPAYKSAYFNRKLGKMVHSNMKDEWQKHQFSIERASKSKDASVEAWGIMSSGLGGRADIMIFDDIVDMGNTLLNPAEQPKVKQMFSGTWLSRIEPSGFAIYVATPWTDTDNTAETIDNPQWSFCMMAVTDSLEGIEVKFKHIDHTHPCYEYINPVTNSFYIPLWEEKWNKEALLVKKTVMTDADFARGYHCKPFSHRDLIFQNFSQCCDNEQSVEDYIAHLKRRIADDSDKIAVNFVTGVDLSSQKRPGNVIFTMAVVQDEGVMVPVDIRSGKWTSPEVADNIVEVYRLYRPMAIYVENNALQEAILQWIAQEIKRNNIPSMPIEGFMTGKQKSNPVIGVPGMEIELKNNMWKFCTKDIDTHDTLCDCPWCNWIREMKLYPFSDTTDYIMAMWFAREAARKYCGLGSLLFSSTDYEDLKKSKSISAMTPVAVDSFYADMYSQPAGSEESDEAVYRW